MAKRTGTVNIDQLFAIPPGVVDMRQAGQEDGSSSYFGGESIAEVPELVSPEDNIPVVPGNFTIVEQIIRTSSDGTKVVDVVFDIPNVSGVSQIDIRVTAV